MFTTRFQFNVIILFALLCCLGLPLQSADELKGWRKTRAEIFAQVEQEVKEQVEATVTLESAAASLNIRLPTSEPQQSVEEVFDEARKEAEKAALAARPLKELQTIVQEAEQIYPLYQVGDQVSIRTRIKSNPIANGIVGAISPERIRIGSRWIPVKDIAEEQRNAFDALKTRDLRTNFVTRQNNMQMAFLKNSTDQFVLETLPEKMRVAGYHTVSNDQNELLNPKNWMPASVAIQQELTRLRKEAAERLRPEIEKKRFTEQKFKYHEGKKEWQPAGVLQSLKNLF